jgi:hypothetical protein
MSDRVRDPYGPSLGVFGLLDWTARPGRPTIAAVQNDLKTRLSPTDTNSQIIGGSMDIPEYVTKDEVRRVCKELGIRDWTALPDDEVELGEAEIIRAEVGGEALEISVEDFKLGLEVELEHGIIFPDANVTNNHPILTGRIALAHLKEMLDYYARLEVAELEGDMLKALVSGNLEKLASKYRKLIEAKVVLSESERISASS